MTTKAKVKVLTIKVNTTEAKKAKFRGARADWLEAIQSYNGKPVAAFCEHVLANPPSTPKTGKYAGQCEPPMGWVRFFIRQGLIETISK